MGRDLRVYVQGDRQFFGQRPSSNYGPGYPGTHYVEFDIEQFTKGGIFKRDVIDAVSVDQRVAGASICLVKMGYGYKPKDAVETDGTVTITTDGMLSYAWAKDPRHVIGTYLKLMDLKVGVLPEKCAGYDVYSLKIPRERITIWRIISDTCQDLKERVKSIMDEVHKRTEEDFSTK